MQNPVSLVRGAACVVGLAAAVCCAACGASSASSRTPFGPQGGSFPTRNQLTQLQDVPAAPIAISQQTAVVDTYPPQVEAPAEAIGQAGYPEPWAAPLNRVLSGSQGRVYASSGMRCFAEEVGRFYLAHQAFPSGALRHHLSAHCGVNHPSPALYFYGGEVGSDSRGAMGKWGQEISRVLEEQLVGGMFSVGLWFGEVGGRATYAAVYAKRTALISRIEVAEGALRVEGQSLGDFAKVRGMLTRGAYGYAECANDPAVRLPRFVITCALAPEDSVAWFEVVGYAAGRVLGEVLAIDRVEGPGFDPAYQRAQSGELAGGNQRERILAAINDWRARAGLDPLALDASQSEINQSAAPHYYAGLFGGEGVLTTDLIALGLIAGWDVEGPVARGYISSQWQFGASDPAALLEHMVRSPSHRRTLLNPRTAKVAIGSIDLGEHSGLVVTTYELFSHTTRAELSGEVLDRLNRLREETGLPPVVESSVAMEEAAAAAARIENPDVDPQSVVSAGLSAVVERSNRPAGSWVLSVDDPDTLELPEELVRVPNLEVGISVTFYRDASDPWGSYYALVYFFGGGQSV